MRQKENILKIKKLCDELIDRDIQLKINEKFLWIILDDISKLKTEVLDSRDKNPNDILEKVIFSLNNIQKLAKENGCKRIKGYE
jgi:hypothetical protein